MKLTVWDALEAFVTLLFAAAILAILLGTLLLFGGVVHAGECGYPVYLNSTYIPTTTYCAPAWEPYHYDCAGWWRGRWFPAGNYQWRGSYWYLQGVGRVDGYACPADYYGHGCASPIAVSQFAAVVSVPVPAFFSVYTPPPEYPGTPAAAPRPAVQAAPVQAPAPAPVARAVPAPAVAACPDLAEVLVAIKTLDGNVTKLDGRLRQLEGPPPPPTAPAPAAPATPAPGPAPAPATPLPAPPARTAALVLTEHCAACHTRGTPYQSGERSTSFALLESPGVLAELDARMVGKVLARIADKSMPPADLPGDHKPLSGDEVATVIADLTATMKGSRSPEPRRRSYAQVPVNRRPRPLVVPLASR